MKLFVLSFLGFLSWLPAAEKLNVLLICVDDLRPELGCYGKDYIHSPNIDALAKEGVLFQKHFVQAPTCGASRYALLTGRYGPAGNEALFERADEMKAGQEVPPSMPGWFREHGYTTVSVGKVSHHPGGRGGTDWDDPAFPEIPKAWDRHLLPAGPWLTPRGWMHGLGKGQTRQAKEKMDVYEAFEGDDSLYPDGVAIPEAVKQLKSLAAEEKPFFLAVGILRPHLPFGAPKKYLDLYDGVELPPIPHPEKPKGQTTWHRSGEFMGYNRWNKDPNKDSKFATDVRRHYAACVSYADAMVGKVMAALEESGEREKTIVVLWGDHGWHLGEHGVWGKHTLFEESLWSPLIVSFPEMKSKNLVCEEVVQTVALFPTLCDLTGLESPDGLSAKSLRGLLENPEAKDSSGVALAYKGDVQTIRNANYRLTLHKNGFVELYDHTANDGEANNRAEENPEVVEALKQQLKELRALE